MSARGHVLCDTKIEPRFEDMMVLRKFKYAFLVSRRATLSSVPVTVWESTVDTWLLRGTRTSSRTLRSWSWSACVVRLRFSNARKGVTWSLCVICAMKPINSTNSLVSKWDNSELIRRGIYSVIVGPAANIIRPKAKRACQKKSKYTMHTLVSRSILPPLSRPWIDPWHREKRG